MRRSGRSSPPSAARCGGAAAPDDAAGLRSIVFTIAAFAAFVSFYSFAGAPTLRLVPGLPHVFQLVVVTTATLFLRAPPRTAAVGVRRGDAGAQAGRELEVDRRAAAAQTCGRRS